MKTILTITFLMFSLHGFSQQQADLRTLTKIPDNADGTIQEIDTLTIVLKKEFLKIANDGTTQTHKDIQAFFKDFKLNEENSENNIYPNKLKPENIYAQFTDYLYNYGWEGKGMDSVLNSYHITSLVFVPAFDNVHKGQVVNTLCFKITIEVEEHSKTGVEKNYAEKIKVTEIKKINL